MPELKLLSFAHACKEFFGSKHGQTAVEFMKELRELTDKDKADMVEMFKTVGIDATKVS